MSLLGLGLDEHERFNPEVCLTVFLPLFAIIHVHVQVTSISQFHILTVGLDLA